MLILSAMPLRAGRAACVARPVLLMARRKPSNSHNTHLIDTRFLTGWPRTAAPPNRFNGFLPSQFVRPVANL
jgi:hypothetical protein